MASDDDKNRPDKQRIELLKTMCASVIIDELVRPIREANYDLDTISLPVPADFLGHLEELGIDVWLDHVEPEEGPDRLVAAAALATDLVTKAMKPEFDGEPKLENQTLLQNFWDEVEQVRTRDYSEVSAAELGDELIMDGAAREEDALREMWQGDCEPSLETILQAMMTGGHPNEKLSKIADEQLTPEIMEKLASLGFNRFWNDIPDAPARRQTVFNLLEKAAQETSGADHTDVIAVFWKKLDVIRSASGWSRGGQLLDAGERYSDMAETSYDQGAGEQIEEEIDDGVDEPEEATGATADVAPLSLEDKRHIQAIAKGDMIEYLKMVRGEPTQGPSDGLLNHLLTLGLGVLLDGVPEHMHEDTVNSFLTTTLKDIAADASLSDDQILEQFWDKLDRLTVGVQHQGKAVARDTGIKM